MADYAMESVTRELNVASAKLAREAVESVMTQDASRRCYVAGALGRPTAQRPFHRMPVPDIAVTLMNWWACTANRRRR